MKRLLGPALALAAVADIAAGCSGFGPDDPVEQFPLEYQFYASSEMGTLARHRIADNPILMGIFTLQAERVEAELCAVPPEARPDYEIDLTAPSQATRIIIGGVSGFQASLHGALAAQDLVLRNPLICAR